MKSAPEKVKVRRLLVSVNDDESCVIHLSDWIAKVNPQIWTLTRVELDEPIDGAVRRIPVGELWCAQRGSICGSSAAMFSMWFKPGQEAQAWLAVTALAKEHVTRLRNRLLRMEHSLQSLLKQSIV